MIGIYKIEDTRTGKVYIGSSKRIHQRWIDHKSQLQRRVHHCKALQKVWDPSYFTHEILEYTDELEDREEYWMQQYSDRLLNTSRVTYNPMRNQESIDKMLATRGDKQKGAGSSSAKFDEETYLQIVYALATTTLSIEALSEYFNLSTRSIRDIIQGDKHKWIAERFPEQFNIMQHWRKEFRSATASGKEPPSIDLPIKPVEFIQERKVWMHLINKQGEELVLYSPNAAENYGLKLKYLSLIKSKKLIRYKGWRLA